MSSTTVLSINDLTIWFKPFDQPYLEKYPHFDPPLKRRTLIENLSNPEVRIGVMIPEIYSENGNIVHGAVCVYLGIPHREDGPAIIRAGVRKEWWQNGLYHRENGPATIDANGSTAWFIHGQRHRLDGPARIWADGDEEWWINGGNITKEFTQWSEKSNIPNWKNWTEHDKLLFRLRF